MTMIKQPIHLSPLQKEVLTKVFVSPNPHVAWEEITEYDSRYDSNAAAAKNMLGRLGLINIGNGTLEITANGEEVLKQEDIIDEFGELTQTGDRIISRGSNGALPDKLPESLRLVREINETLAMLKLAKKSS